MSKKNLSFSSDFEQIQYIYFCLYQIMYNITVLLFELDVYHDRKQYFFMSENLKNTNTQTIDGTRCLFCGDCKYYRNNNILYMEKNNNTYWNDMDTYWVKSDGVISVDPNNTFKSINELILYDFNMIKVLNSTAKILNNIVGLDKFVKIYPNKIHFINDCNCKMKLINLNFFFYLNNGSFRVKEMWEFLQFIDDKKNIILMGINLLYLLNEFSTIHIKIISNNFFLKSITFDNDCECINASAITSKKKNNNNNNNI
jgi:hypothetical protein